MSSSPPPLNWDEVGQQFGLAIVATSKLAGGRNNQIFRVELKGGRTILLKKYAPIDDTGRDRRRTEYDAISFLTRNGVRNVPWPLGSDAALNVALYTFVAGDPPPADAVDEELVDSAVSFYEVLTNLRTRSDAQDFGPASEAFFALDALVENLRARFARIERMGDDPRANASLRSFIDAELRGAVDSAVQGAVAGAGDDTLRLDRSFRTLSPSDVGFHNMLCRRGSEPVFVDFEYFGWDDPVKLVSDFLTQHDFEVTPALASRFLAAMFWLFGEDPDLPRRLTLYYPIFRAKKALIALNEFVPGSKARREFANARAGEDGLVARQIGVARNVLARELPAYDHAAA